MKLIAKIDFNANGNFYKKGQEVKVSNINQVIKLNELGFIEPLSINDIQNFGKEEIKKEEPKKVNKKYKIEEE